MIYNNHNKIKSGALLKTLNNKKAMAPYVNLDGKGAVISNGAEIPERYFCALFAFTIKNIKI